MPDRRQFVATLTAGILGLGSGCLGTLEEATSGGGETWLPREEIEGGVWKDGEGWVREDQLLDLVNGEINSRRHDRGLGTADFDISLKNELTSEARMDVGGAPSGVETVEDPFRCRGRQIKVHVTISYDSKYDDEDGLLINADRDTIATDVVDRMAASDEMSEVLFDPTLESHAARVNVGDQGTVYIPNVFCGPES